MSESSSKFLNVVTGATGLIGSHLVEQLVHSGRSVRALVRVASDTRFLTSLGVELAYADLNDADAVSKGINGAATVFHCASRMYDWGPWSQFQTEILNTTRNVLLACRHANVRRVVHISSMAAYGRPKIGRREITENEPLAQRLWVGDHYCRAKAISEQIARENFPQVTIIRPTWTYGPRERNSFPRVFRALKNGKAMLIGSGDNLLNLIHAGDVARGCIMAVANPVAVGEVYHLAGEQLISQRRFYEILSQELGCAPVNRRVPLRLAFAAGWTLEVLARALHRPRPFITRHGVSVISRPAAFSAAKARRDLSWRAEIDPEDGLRAMVRWFIDQGAIDNLPQASTIESPN